MRIILFILFFLVGNALWAADEAKISSHSVAELQKLLIKHGVFKNNLEMIEKEKLFKARTTAHRIRLMELFGRLQKDKNFAAQFPEFKELLSYPEKALKAVEMHDLGKVVPENNNAVRVLSWLQGIDYRNQNAKLPTDVDARIRLILKGAIDDVNLFDKKHSAVDLFGKKAESLTEILDYYDTYKSRQDEIAQDGRKLKKPSEWLNFLPKSDGFETKMKLAIYLETEDPLKIKSAFTQTVDIYKRMGPLYQDEAVRIHAESHQVFKNEMDRLGRSRRRLQVASRAISSVPPVARVGGAASLALTALDVYHYLDQPEDFKLRQSIENTVVGMTFTTETASCATRNCSLFFERCAQQINFTKSTYYKEIMSQPDFKKCLYKFFDSPLHEQTELRKDSDLNRILLPYSPTIRTVQCRAHKDKTEIEFHAMAEIGEIDHQSLTVMTASKKPLAIARLPNKEDLITFDDGQPDNLKHCNIGHTCKQYPMSLVNTEKTYFWKNENIKIIPASLVNKIPIDSFIWSKQYSKLIELQNHKLTECCDSLTCRTYFKTEKIELTRALDERARRQLASQPNNSFLTSPEELSDR